MDILSALQVVTQSIKNWTQNKIDGIELGSQSDWNESDTSSPSYIKNKPVISGGGISDHNDLTNRDASNQHPISAIDGLQAALDDKQPTGDYAPGGHGLGTPAVVISNQDLVDVIKKAESGWYRGNNVTNAPSSNWYYFEIIASSLTTDGVTNYASVTAYNLTGDIFYTTYYNGALKTWKQVYEKPDEGILKTDLESSVQQALEKADGTSVPVEESTAGFKSNQIGWCVNQNQSIITMSLNKKIENLSFTKQSTTSLWATEDILIPVDMPLKNVSCTGSVDKNLFITDVVQDGHCVKFQLKSASTNEPTYTNTSVNFIAQGQHATPPNDIPSWNSAGAQQAISVLNTYFQAKEKGRVFGYNESISTYPDENWTYISGSHVNASNGDAMMVCATLVFMVLCGIPYDKSPYATTTANYTADFSNFFANYNSPYSWALSKRTDSSGNTIRNWVLDPRLKQRCYSSGRQSWWFWENNRVFFPVNSNGDYDPSKLRDGDIILLRKTGHNRFDNISHVAIITVEDNVPYINNISYYSEKTKTGNGNYGQHLWKMPLSDYIDKTYPIKNGVADFYFARPDYGRQ